MLEIPVYRGRDNRVTLRLEAKAVRGGTDTDPPLKDATRVTLTSSSGVTLDSDADPGLTIVDDERLYMVLGPAFSAQSEPEDAFLIVYYPDAPNGVAWPGDAGQPREPTFRLQPVEWPDGSP